jgi:hypothetical protein
MSNPSGPFVNAPHLKDWPTPDPADQWIDELEMLVHGLTRPAFVAKLRRLPQADRDRYLAELQALKRSLADLLYADGHARAFQQPGVTTGRGH